MATKGIAAFLPHGGGPMPLLGDPGHQPMVDYMSKEFPKVLGKPKAILLVTAHWEEKEVNISSAETHSLLYDYYGFPAEAYKVKFPAPGHPEVAKKAHELLTAAGITSKLNPTRGWDHGVFVPLKVVLPNADIPIVQMSLNTNLDPALHYRIGAALRPLRDEGVAIIGSGMSFHNMSALRSVGFGRHSANGVDQQAAAFDNAIREVVAAEPVKRELGLAKWSSLPGSRYSQPREEHFIPLVVVAGAAAEDEKGEVLFSFPFANAFPVSGFIFQ